MRSKAKNYSLVFCLLVFLFVIIGGCADAGGEGAPTDLALARERNPGWL
jgi:hypothetical protein